MKKKTETLKETSYGGTHFRALPAAERAHGSDGRGGIDDKCCCPWCSPVAGESRDDKNRAGVWDTLATDLSTGKTWKVHFPQLHGRRRLRRDERRK